MHSSFFIYRITLTFVTLTDTRLKGVNVLDIAALSIGLSQASLGQNVNIALAKKVMETSQQSNEQLLKVLQAPHPTHGNVIDVKG
jgi:Putative motility protein